jgi:FAD/FMN-containing dehydrogenase
VIESERMRLAESLGVAYQGKLLTEATDMAPFLLDWRKRYQGKAIAVAQPASAHEVAQVVKWCASHQVPVVAQGGNTGLSGGSVPDDSGKAIVISLAKMNKVRAIDTVNNTITVEAGCILQNLQDEAVAVNRLFGVSLAAKGSCTVGGNLSTNAGGVQVIRYGNMREQCLGLEVVTADGEIWDGLRGLRKDNTGYDLRDLFVGAEGTLGVITAAVLKLQPLPVGQIVAMCVVDSPSAALDFLAIAQSRLGGNLSAFELMSNICLDLVQKHNPQAKQPFPNAQWTVLIEVSDLHSEQSALEMMNRLLESAFEDGCISDATLSQSIAQFRDLWRLREDISEAQASEGKNIKHDVAVPISTIAQFIETTNAEILQAHPGVRMVVFGHLGDGNLHYNVSPPADRIGPQDEAWFMAQQTAINLITHNSVAKFNGSVSAEHGLGVLRRDEASRYKSPVEMALMRKIKLALDPHNLMNPGKVLVL